PFPYDNKRIKPRDDRYWREHRTTPKAYVTLATGQRLWGSRFGRLTSIRLAPAAGVDLTAPPEEFHFMGNTEPAEQFGKHLLAHLQTEPGGFVLEPVRER